MRGVDSVCGKLLLHMLTEQSAEARGCSSKQISWRAIMQQVTFDYSVEKKTREMFIWVIKQMTNSERQSLLKFWSGASRLIPNRDYTVANQYVETDIADKSFPEAHTCGFTIDIAPYSTREIMLG